ncbi:MAG: GIY-YIG nuclease family protein [Candidatus Blackburnbacteria bacterium]|nr:GIY-YIG nuclease family protein [Candidatus Blackburnbacteria bacterium]
MKYSYIYMMTNKTNTTLYTGVTSELVKRVWQHKNKLGSAFTAKYNLTKLVYYEVFEDITEAIKREKQVKNLVRRKKDQLISNFNPEWNDLYDVILEC